jgi:hypothetical protein
MDRRAFFKHSGRWAILGSLALVTGVVLFDRRVTNGKCVVSDICKGCNSFSNCTKEQAINQRQNGDKQED